MTAHAKADIRYTLRGPATGSVPAAAMSATMTPTPRPPPT